jgi:hypothetical protein
MMDLTEGLMTWCFRDPNHDAGPKRRVTCDLRRVSIKKLDGRIREFTFLNYFRGCMTRVPLENSPVITGPMSGCWLMSYRNDNERKTYAVHIGTDEIDPTATSLVKEAWNTLTREPGKTVVGGFKPGPRRHTPLPKCKEGESDSPTFLGIFATDGKYYSICTYPFEDKSNPKLPIKMLRIAEVKLVPSENPEDLKGCFVTPPELPFLIDNWKSKTVRSFLYKRSPALKDLDGELDLYFRTQSKLSPRSSNKSALAKLDSKFSIWKNNKNNKNEFGNLSKIECVKDLQNWLKDHVQSPST